ncbi:MAG: fibronectin type III domain-containing protein, partial [Opitutaceae bacterium]
YTVPQTPANPFAIPLAPDQVSVQWAEPLNGSHVEYLIKRSTDGVTFTQVASVADALTYIDTAATGLAGGQRYYYQVQALSYAGASAVSQTTAAVTTPLTGTGMPLGSIVGQPAMVLWLKGDAGLSAISAINPGNGLDFWGDQSGNTNDGTQATVARPTLEMEATNLAQSNSLPVVHFNESQGAQYIQLPNVMENPSTGQEAQQGEIFAVVRSGNTSFYNDLWTWGTAGSNLYPNDDGTISDDFGSARLTNTGVPAQNIQQFHVYNISSSASEWTQRFDGLVNYDRLSNTVGFATAPMLSAPGDYFFGDIAEVIVYNQVLNQPQRDAVYRYLGNKYGLYNIPATPTGLAATPLSPDQISLQWLAPLNGSHVEYLVGRSTDGVNFAPVASVADALSYIDTGLNPATTYYYQIQAQGYAGLSAPFPGSGYPSVSATTLLNGGAADMPLNMRLWLKADAGLEVTASGDGIDFWGDQSGNANDATQNIASNRPTLVTSQLNGFPAVHFNRNQGAQSFNLPNVMGNPSAPGQQAQAGEIFAVVRSDNNPFPNNLWTWGTSGSALYPNDDGTIADGFGSTTLTNTGIPPVNIQQFHLYNISSSSAEWTQRFDGVVNYDAVGNAVGFRTAPTLGGGGSNFLGDIAEIIVYNYVLSPQQRETVGFYLNSKYAFAPGRPIAFDTYRDGNYDGLPDGLDRQLGFNPASLDVDNDGDTNLQDILEGLDPLDPNSMPPPPPPPDPGEPAPTITLTAPTGAVSQN